MVGGTAIATQHHGLSAMDAAAASTQERGYYRSGMDNNESSPHQVKRPGTTASARTAPLANRTGNNNNGNNSSGGVSSTGLIRLTLKKPMGIVFEPMEDPHNPSQQRGVRICDLPRTGAAALSGQLEIGDELLSINNKTMSRLTFDEIMDFIIEADADNVDLLFRRPKKDSRNPVNDSSKKGSNVKWVDGAKNEKVKKVVTEVIEPEPDDATYEEETNNKKRNDSPPRKHHSGKKGRESSKRSQRDEESVQSADDTFYTETTDYTEETRQRSRRRGRRSRRIESESFLDMLIDSLCAPVIGDGRRGDDDSDDDTYDDDATYDTYDDDESYINVKKKKWNERKKKEKEMQERAKREKKKKEQQKKKRDSDEDNSKENIQTKSHVQSVSLSNSQSKSKSSSFEAAQFLHDEQRDDERVSPYNEHAPPPPPPPPKTAHDSNNMDNNVNFNMMMNANNSQPRNHFQPNIVQAKDNAEESLIPDPNIPITELEYDDQVDHAADVSVMDSIGGPSLLLENLRNASKIVKTVSSEIILKFGSTYPQELGLTKEESIQIDPMKFYKWVVKNLLETHEPEKLRLIDKLFEKYKGREEHLIYKLNARYTDEADEGSKKSSNLQNTSGSNEEDGDYDGFKAFGGDFSKSESKDSQSKNTFDKNGWPVAIGEEEEEEEEEDDHHQSDKADESNDEEHSDEYSHSDDYESIDGTSPDVIAKVSELLNYVYGKTSVPGQIDRVSTIMRAYEGRTSVLLELLETKALLKANAAAAADEEPIPDSLKENPGLMSRDAAVNANGQPVLSPISNMTGGNSTDNSANNRIENQSPRQQKTVSDKSNFFLILMNNVLITKKTSEFSYINLGSLIL